jgi:molybdopterin-guanine dinucleotide biosynthesis protein B
VGVIKHVSCELQLADADSSRYRAFASVVAAASPAEAEIIVKGEKSLDEMLRYCAGCDLILVEGYKRERRFPKIVCLREKEEKEELFDGTNFTASFRKESRLPHFQAMLTFVRWRISRCGKAYEAGP